MTPLAALGGSPTFPDGLPFARPAVPPLEQVMRRLAPSYERGALTNGPLVRELEEAVVARLGARHVVAVSSCTAGLMLTLQALAPRSPVVLPSFTFSATGHAVLWNRLRPLFADCDPRSFQLDVASARSAGSAFGAIVATHVFGAPAPAEALEKLAAAAGVPLVFDAAHAFGALRDGRAVGTFGDAEVFSLSPTKPLVAGEGGLIATPRDDVADLLRMGRDYGNPGDYDTRFAGLNARMSELHAAVALEAMCGLDAHLDQRRALADRYLAGLRAVPGVRPQAVALGDLPTWKDFTVLVEDDYGLARDELRQVLGSEGVDTRCYFDPPVHRQTAYRDIALRPLPVTDRVSAGVLSLPLHAQMGLADVDAVVGIMEMAHRDSGAVRSKLVDAAPELAAARDR